MLSVLVRSEFYTANAHAVRKSEMSVPRRGSRGHRQPRAAVAQSDISRAEFRSNGPRCNLYPVGPDRHAYRAVKRLEYRMRGIFGSNGQAVHYVGDKYRILK